MKERARLFGPLVEISRLQSELNRLFAGVLETHRAMPDSPGFDPATDILVGEKEVVIVVEVPGIAAGDLSVGIQAGSLRVRGVKRHDGRPRRPATFLCMERFFGEFEKLLPLPAPVNGRDAHASLHDGLLIIRLPRVPDQRRKFMEIPVSGGES